MRITIHMAASLDGFIARNDGTVDWMDSMGWACGDKPTYVLTLRELPKVRPTVEFCAGDRRGDLVFPGP